MPGHINFKWNHSNLDNGRALGKAAAEQAIKAYKEHEKRKPHPGPHFINENPEEEDPKGWKSLRDTYVDCLNRAKASAPPPRNIAEALGNLCMLLAATVGEDDVKLFRFHVKERQRVSGWAHLRDQRRSRH